MTQALFSPERIQLTAFLGEEVGVKTLYIEPASLW